MRQINLTYSCNRNCSYCFAKGFLERWPQEISLENLEFIFEWFAKQGIKNLIGLNGGEPTLFSKMNSALELAEKYGLKIVIYTNGILDPESLNLNSQAIDYFLVNLNPPSEYSPQELEILYFNLKTIRKTTRKVGLRFNITSPDISYDYIIEVCKRLNISYVEFVVVFPSTFNQNEYIRKENLKNFSGYLLQLTKDLLKNDIRGQLGEPLPLCIFSKEERKFLMKTVSLRGVCNAGKNYAITPDLTVLPCVALAIEGPSLDKFENEEEIVNYFEETVEDLEWKVNLFPQCKDCPYKKNKQCQGGCLVYKFFQVKNHQLSHQPT